MPHFHVRHLPHYYAIGQPIFITCRLHGSLPAGRWFPPDLASGRAFVLMDRLLDAACTWPDIWNGPKLPGPLSTPFVTGTLTSTSFIISW